MRFGGLAVCTGSFTFGFWLLFTGCGARTDLEPGTASVPDAGRDAARDALPDAPPPDAGLDATPDAAPDVDLPPGCDAGDSSILLLNTEGDLFRFDPSSLLTRPAGRLNCGDQQFNSMTVSRTGRLYVNSGLGELFSADLDTLVCEKTPFDASQVNFSRYGMGFTADDVPAGESLFVAPRNEADFVDRLARIDLDDFKLYDIGYFPVAVPAAEVKGSGDGRLYLVHMADVGQSARLVEVDKETGALGSSVELPLMSNYRAFDFAYFGGAFYVFITLDLESDSAVYRYTPELETVEALGRVPVIVVGAGVSTCAPL